MNEVHLVSSALPPTEKGNVPFHFGNKARDIT